MQAFADQHKVHVNLSTRDRLDLIVLESCSSQQSALALSLHVGVRLGIASSPMGWALLAALPDVERFYLLTGGPSPGAGAVASSLAGTNGGEVALGQTFSLGINQLLRESVGNVAVSIGTSDDRPSYSASVRLSDRLTFQGSFRPPSEAKREETTSDLTGSLDYQISRRWLLRTELGTTGGAFDLLWSHRY